MGNAWAANKTVFVIYCQKYKKPVIYPFIPFKLAL